MRLPAMSCATCNLAALIVYVDTPLRCLQNCRHDLQMIVPFSNDYRDDYRDEPTSNVEMDHRALTVPAKVGAYMYICSIFNCSLFQKCSRTPGPSAIGQCNRAMQSGGFVALATSPMLAMRPLPRNPFPRLRCFRKMTMLSLTKLLVLMRASQHATALLEK